VDVELEHKGDDVVARVRDSGIGIALEHHERIFDKFFTVDGGSARTHGGTGIGLYLAREVVAIHDGSIRVDSTPGRGATFEVWLPLRPQG
jgi:signal transduction histidine kinase